MKIQISEKLKAITQAYLALADGNNAFNFQVSGVDGFRNLIEQRNLVVEDLDVLGADLIATLNQNFQGHGFPCGNLTEAILAVSILLPELGNDCDAVKDALRALVESDARVENDLAKLRDDLKLEIGRVRQGARGLRGYRQTETFGSCFINKVK